MSYTFFLLKPDAVERGLVIRILDDLLYRHFAIARLELRRATLALAEAHYAEHVGKAFFPTITEFLASGPLVAGVLSRPAGDAVVQLRDLIGGYADPGHGTIRRVYKRRSEADHRNLIHAADSPEAAIREAELWFGPGGLSAV